jgi:GBP family porin
MGFNVAAAYMQLNNNVNALSLAATDPGAVAGDWTFAAIRQRTWGAGLNYTFGSATSGFVFTQTRLTDSRAISAAQSGVTGGITGLSGGTRFNNYEVNGRYALTPALSIAGSYTYTDGRIVGQTPSWHQFNLQTAYALSKRTDVYLQGEYQRVSADGLNLHANINGLGAASSTNKQISVTAGLRHRF